MRGRPFIKGQKPWNYAQKERQCLNCGKTFMIAPYRFQSAKFCSRKCNAQYHAQEQSLRMKGEQNPFWNGGISITYYRRIFRDKLPHKCNQCGHKRYLTVHHKDGNRQNNELLNLEVLCRSCHAKFHKAWEHIQFQCPQCGYKSHVSSFRIS